MKKRRRWPKVLLSIIGIGLALELIFMGVIYLVSARARSITPVKSDAIIVLGARVNPNGQMSSVLHKRIHTGLALHQQGMADSIIVCGGQGPDEPMGEAVAMAEYLAQNGVPESQILLDDTSVDTNENLAHAKLLMERHGLKTAILVTSDYHLTRALWQARDAGLTISGAPAPGPDTAYKFVEAYFRESVSWVNYWTGGFIDKLLFWR